MLHVKIEISYGTRKSTYSWWWSFGEDERSIDTDVSLKCILVFAEQYQLVLRSVVNYTKRITTRWSHIIDD